MRPQWIAVLVSVLLVGCSAMHPGQRSGPVPLAYGSASSLTPLVAATPTPSSCLEPSDAPIDSGMRAVALHYPGPPERQVTVTLDAVGEPIRYVDVRGDLANADSEVLDRTTIGLYLQQGYAVLSNRDGAGEPSMLEVPLDEVLASPRLGNPEATMDEVLSACGGAI